VPGFHLKSNASSVAIHKMYDRVGPNRRIINDIAVVRLQRPFPFSSYLGPATLAGVKSPNLTLNEPCIVAGFGKSTNNPGSSGQ